MGSKETRSLEALISEVDRLTTVSQYLRWLSHLNEAEFSIWKAWPHAEYYVRSALEIEEERRRPVRQGLRLTIELVPSPCWYGSLREKMPQATWDKLRKQVYARYQWQCGICYASKVTLHCHEIWQYDDERHIQKLTGFICLCEMCHHCKHIGLAGIRAAEGQLDFKQVVAHFLRVNQCSPEEYEAHSQREWETWRVRCGHSWITDLGDYAHLVKS